MLNSWEKRNSINTTWRVKLGNNFQRVLSKFSCTKSAKKLVTLITWFESNPALWLAIRTGKMALSYTMGTTRYVPQEFFFPKPYNKSFIDKACLRSRWLDIGRVLFLRVYGPKRDRRPQTCEKKQLKTRNVNSTRMNKSIHQKLAPTLS